MSANLLLALALMLIIEGIFPFLFPGGWRDTFRKISAMPEHRVRIGGLVAMSLGLLLLWLVNGSL